MRIGLIAGDGDLPKYIANENPNAFVMCIEGFSEPTSFLNQSETVSLFNPEIWVKTLNTYKVTHIVFAGKILRPNIFKENSSILARELINKISSVGDNKALNIIETFFKTNGFKIIPISSVLKNCFFSKGFYGKNFLNPIFLEYIQKSTKFGISLLNNISKFDVGQSLVVSHNLVYAVEAMEGTDSMLERVKKLTLNNENAFNNPPILIKIPKKGQNKKIDLPVVGFNTVKKCVDARIGSIVVSSRGTIIIDLKKINAFIAKTNFSIFSV